MHRHSASPHAALLEQKQQVFELPALQRACLAQPQANVCVCVVYALVV